MADTTVPKFKRPHNFRNLAGQKFGRLTVLYDMPERVKGNVRWLCLCLCGKQSIAHTYSLKSGKTKSCGCLKVEKTKNRATTHGGAKDGKLTNAYRSWRAMHARCTNSKQENFKYYGGRGITVCERWKKFENFLEDMGPRPVGMTIDRKDNNGPYGPDNCHWATQPEQYRNRNKFGHYLTLNGVTLCIRDWGYRLGISRGTISKRLKRGLAIEKVLSA